MCDIVLHSFQYSTEVNTEIFLMNLSEVKVISFWIEENIKLVFIYSVVHLWLINITIPYE